MTFSEDGPWEAGCLAPTCGGTGALRGWWQNLAPRPRLGCWGTMWAETLLPGFWLRPMAALPGMEFDSSRRGSVHGWGSISECVGLDSETASGLSKKMQHSISTACPGNRMGRCSLCATYLNFLVKKTFKLSPPTPTFLSSDHTDRAVVLQNDPRSFDTSCKLNYFSENVRNDSLPKGLW